eukprot:8483661-Alexandrium_andersonii.AAC.1
MHARALVSVRQCTAERVPMPEAGFPSVAMAAKGSQQSLARIVARRTTSCSNPCTSAAIVLERFGSPA